MVNQKKEHRNTTVEDSFRKEQDEEIWERKDYGLDKRKRCIS